MEMKDDWINEALCGTGDPDALFVQGAAQNVAKKVCLACPVRYECLAEALDKRIGFGVWGGMTERERRALLKRSPHVPSWRRMFETVDVRGIPKDAALQTAERCGGVAVSGAVVAHTESAAEQPIAPNIGPMPVEAAGGQIPVDESSAA